MGIENIVLDKNQHEDQLEKLQRYSMEDDKMLVNAWLTISTDSVVGTAQNDETFWKRVTEYFMKIGDLVQEEKQIGDLVQEEKQINCKKHFIYEYVWVMLKDDPKWKTSTSLGRSLKKLKINENGAYTSSSNEDTCIDIDDSEVEVCPIGRKAGKAKTKAKQKGKANMVEKSNIDEEMEA
ncbi:uncharacterized protein LOC120270288 [Dioscorea cayenensis subsp. rotundata]|uniref:Uncharacterized protein LOC120270288 n=1 Tax=Dioscorea cayennensis subsp. rotundata TaxID=55577 RepID=A0AB40C0J1_DIOCR|nr:uncharacterized protein LOC120270288 [Dioscorea cayenensis subsp. rotundata]